MDFAIGSRAAGHTAKADELAAVTSNYSYDSIYELTQVLQGTTTDLPGSTRRRPGSPAWESYSYDPVGNRTASLGVASYTTNTSNEMTANSNASYTYDANGNTLTKVVGSNTTSYAWDYENRLTSVTLPSSGGTVTFKYDPFGRRIEKISPSATSIFLYDGDNLVQTVNSSGSVIARYAQGLTIDEPLAMERGTTIDYYEADGLGSITSLTTASGTVAQSYTYDSFGNLTNSSGSLTNFLRYAGREFDTETGLYYYRGRYYDSTAGRFASEDPVHFTGGVNFFRYVGNNPVLFSDPTGLCPASSPSTPYQKFKNFVCHPVTALYAGAVAGAAAPLSSLGGSAEGGAILTLYGEAGEAAAVSGPVGWGLFLGFAAWGFYCL